MNDLIIALVTFICCILFVLCFIFFGWYIVWKCCLSKFRFVRELLGGMSENPNVEDKKERKPRKIRRE